MAPSRLEVARVGRAHGLRGEVAVTFTSNRPERTAARRHQGRWLVQFDDVRDRTQAEQLLGVVLTGDVIDDQDLGDHLWVHEMIGSAVVDRDGHELGTVASVEANPAHDLLVLDGGALIPIVFVTEHAAGRIIVDVPDGLFEL
jgi:16S rRNA processing protein RimM